MGHIYPDVSPISPHAEAIEFVTINGLMLGDHKGNFNPKNVIHIPELCVIIVHVFDLSPQYCENEITHVPDWALPYFCACQNANLLPEDFLPRINDKAKIKDILEVFEIAQKNFFKISFSISKEIYKNFPENNLTKEICASLIYQFFKNAADEVNSKLLDSTHTELNHFLSLIDQYFLIRELVSSDIYQICTTLKAPRSDTKLSEQKEKFVYMRDICNLKQELLYHGTEPFYHYTSLDTLDKLTRPGAKFRLSNTAYLNDPKEGKLGMKLLADLSVTDSDNNKIWSPLQIDDEALSIYPTFIASFMKKPDKLPMWVQYGDKGAGCCLGFSCDYVTEPLYAVQYSEDKIKSFFSHVIKILENYQHNFSIYDCDSDPVFKYARNILIQGCFLYKADSYEHEDEVRIIMFVPFSKAKASAPATSDSSVEANKLLSKIFAESPLTKNSRSDIGLNFISITLGPTVQNPEQVAVALAQRGYDPKIIKKSKINFR